MGGIDLSTQMIEKCTSTFHHSVKTFQDPSDYTYLVQGDQHQQLHRYPSSPENRKKNLSIQHNAHKYTQQILKE